METEEEDDGVGVESMGSLSRSEVNQGFLSVSAGLMGCYEDGLARLPNAAGNVTFHVGVSSEGRVEWAFLERADLGLQEVQACMLDAVRGAQFVRPHGGATEAVLPMDWSPPEAVRSPVEWSQVDVESALGGVRPAIDGCLGGATGFSLTLYVAPGGTVAAAGATPPDVARQAQADCLAGAALGWMLPDPGPDGAKVTLTF